MLSQVREIGPVDFPAFTGERVYMQEFTRDDWLPESLSRWSKTVEQMMSGIKDWTVAYLMIDQGAVRVGNTHRRGGAHIDGNWIPAMNQHGGIGGHGPRPSHKARNSSDGLWRSENFSDEALVLASDVSACVAYVGSVNGHPKVGGDCSHLDLSRMEKVRLSAGKAYSGNVTMVHESLPIDFDCNRTLVRINVPGVKI